MNATKHATAALIWLVPAIVFYVAATRRKSAVASAMDWALRYLAGMTGATEATLAKWHLATARFIVGVVFIVFLANWCAGFPERIGDR